MKLGHHQRLLWWLILRVNLPGLRDAQIAGKTLFLGVAARVSLEEISIWLGRLRKDHPHQCRWASSSLLRIWIEESGRNRANFLFNLSWNIHFFLSSDIGAPGFQVFGLGAGLASLAPQFLSLWTGTKTPGSLVFRPLESDWITPPASWFSSLQMADHGTSWPP